jgi:hypothetical protein
MFHWLVRPRDFSIFHHGNNINSLFFFFQSIFFYIPWASVILWSNGELMIQSYPGEDLSRIAADVAIFANQTSMVRTGPKSASITGRKSPWRTSYYSDHWIGLRENLQETMVFTIKYRDFLYFFPSSNSMKWSIHWLWELWFTRILVMYSRWLRCFTIFLPGFITVFHELSSGQTSSTINKHIYEYLANDIINKHHIINHHSTIININKHVNKL